MNINFKEIMPKIITSGLFSGISPQEAETMINCLSPRLLKFKKNSAVLSLGEKVSSMGIIVEGCVHIVRDDFWGNRNILSKAVQGDLFAEVYACSGLPLEVGVFAECNTEVLFLSVEKILKPCGSACSFHSKLIQNLLRVTAAKNLAMNAKLAHITQRSTRDKLFSYLSAESIKSGSPEFTIPFNRQELADYLSVDRSAMSNELCKMRDEGLLSFEKNHFTLI